LSELFGVNKPIIGMVHLMPLPGAPAYEGWSTDEVIEYALRDARILVENGVDGLIVENMWDLPYYASRRIPPEEVAAHAVAAREIAKSFNIPVGITSIHNGGRIAPSAYLNNFSAFSAVNPLPIMTGVSPTTLLTHLTSQLE